MDYLRRNIMTVALLLFAVGAAAAEMASALPGDAGTDLATVALIAAAAGRALVRAVEELSGPDIPPPLDADHVHAERLLEGELPDFDDHDEMPPPPAGCCALEAEPDPAADIRPREV